MAKQSIGKASLILGTATAGLSSGLGRARSMIVGFKNSVSGLFSAGTKAVGAVGGLAGLVAGGLSVHKVMSDIDRLATENRMARGLGLSTREMGRLSAAFNRVGLDTEAVADVVSDLSDKIQDGAVNGGEAAETLRFLGLEAKSLEGLNPAEQFYKVADAIASVDEDATRAGLTVRLLSDNGLKLLPLFRGGAVEFRKIGDEAERFGAVLSDTDAAKLDLASGAMKRVELAFSGGWRRIVVAATPFVEFVADLIPQAIEGLGPFFDRMGEYAVPVLHGIAVGAGNVWDTFRAGSGIVSIVTATFTEGLGYIVEGFKELVSLAQSMPDSMRPDWVNGLIDATDRFEKHIKDSSRNVRAMGWQAVNSWGQSANRVDAWFQGWENRRNKAIADQSQQLAKPPSMATPTGFKKPELAEALEKGSKEEYSVRARFEANRTGDTIARQQLETERRQETILGAIAGSQAVASAAMNQIAGQLPGAIAGRNEPTVLPSAPPAVPPRERIVPAEARGDDRGRAFEELADSHAAAARSLNQTASAAATASAEFRTATERLRQINPNAGNAETNKLLAVAVRLLGDIKAKVGTGTRLGGV